MIPSLIDIGSKLIDKLIPDKVQADEAKLKLLQLQQDGQLKLEEFKHEEAQSQADINKVEAQSSNLFVAGWRPCIGWMCCIGLFYQFLLQPVIMGIITNEFPVLDTGTLMALVTSLLGFGGYRTVEKIKGRGK
jgi:hypothetical protein